MRWVNPPYVIPIRLSDINPLLWKNLPRCTTNFPPFEGIISRLGITLVLAHWYYSQSLGICPGETYIPTLMNP